MLGRVSVIGSGIAGMAITHFLRPHAKELTLFEKDSRIGGHTHTITVGEQSFDTGFMVYNEVTYPYLTRLFRELGVETMPTDMSFSVQVEERGLEYSGSSLNHLFSQRRNLLNPSFWRLLLRINRFNESAFRLLSEPGVESLTLRQFVDRHGLGEDFLQEFLVPMSSAVWSTPRDQMMEFPAHTLIRFFHNHGFLGLHTQHPWRTVRGGSRQYLQKLTAPYRDWIRSGDPVVSVKSMDGCQRVRTLSGAEQEFDQVILASHADESLAMLADPSPMEKRLLACFKYQPNPTIIHSDPSVMPRKRLAWSSWNYRIDCQGHASTHYWMNCLQSLPDHPGYFVSLNDPGRVRPELIHRRIDYTHPIFDLDAVAAQRELPLLNREGSQTGRYFCGSYFRYGFHEDALGSSVALARQILGESFWT